MSKVLVSFFDSFFFSFFWKMRKFREEMEGGMKLIDFILFVS